MIQNTASVKRYKILSFTFVHHESSKIIQIAPPSHEGKKRAAFLFSTNEGEEAQRSSVTVHELFMEMFTKISFLSLED